LQAGSIRQDETTIAKLLSVKIDGQVESHSISLESTLANDANLNIKAKGRLLNEQWQVTPSNVIYDCLYANESL
jgi:hypothetical protein